MGIISLLAQYAAYMNDKNYVFHFMGERDDDFDSLNTSDNKEFVNGDTHAN